jgi:argininosuccinate synthase
MKHQTKHKRVLLAFSGGLDTSAIIPWLKEFCAEEVVAYCSDLGNAPNAGELGAWAHQLGACEFIFEDVKDHFVSKFAFRAVRANATYQDDYLLGTSLGRPLIAERMAHFAKKLGATAVSHGCTGKGNDQLRLERSWAYLIPQLEVIAPWRRWDFTGRGDLLAYLQSHGFTLSAKDKIYSEDVNLFHRSCEGGVLENPAAEFDPADIYQWVQPVNRSTSEGVNLEVAFERGVAVAVNQSPLGPAALLGLLNDMAGRCGVGVQDIVEERTNGIKSRGVYETPGGSVLHVAIRALKHLCWDRSLMTTARSLAGLYGECIYDGYWHTDLRKSLDAFFDKACETLTGSVKLHLRSGNIRVLSRESPFSLYEPGTVSFETDPSGVHKLADGYCKITALKQKQLGLRDLKNGRV